MELSSELDRLRSKMDKLQKYEEIQNELEKDEKRYPQFPDGIFVQLANVQEKAGEITKAVLKCRYEGSRISDIEYKLIQTASMCMRMLGAIRDDSKKVTY